MSKSHPHQQLVAAISQIVCPYCGGKPSASTTGSMHTYSTCCPAFAYEFGERVERLKEELGASIPAPSALTSER